MISNTQTLYELLKDFQDKRSALVADYEHSLNVMEKYKGSEGYEEDIKKLQEAHEKELADLKSKYRPSIDIVLNGMEDAISKRTMNPPTAQQLRALQVLQMRDKVSREELDRVANTVKDSIIAMGVVQEIAIKNGIRNANYAHRATEMSSEYAQDMLDGMKYWTEDFLSSAYPRSARLADEHNRRLYGEGSRAELTKRRTFDTLDECFEILFNVDHDTQKKFAKVVNGEGESDD